MVGVLQWLMVRHHIVHHGLGMLFSFSMIKMIYGPVYYYSVGI